jgi:DNA replication protein DnaC
MAYDPIVLRRATEELERRRSQQQTSRARLRADAYRRQPRLEQLDRQLQGTMAQLVSAALRKGEDPARAVREIRGQNLALQQERAALLEQLGLERDALEDAPNCPLCGDSGWRGTRMCACLKEIYTREQNRELSKLLDLGSQSFETFRMDYYSPVAQSSQFMSPRENMEWVLRACRDFVENFGKGGVRNLYFHGSPGLGKTFLSACIARAVSEQGYSVVYDTAGNIFAQFEQRKFQRFEDSRQARDETRRYLNCDLLILDDLGSELTTQFTQSALYELINTRLVAGRKTVISSNLSLPEMAQRYSPQIASRIGGEFHDLWFFGEDIRILKKQR